MSMQRNAQPTGLTLSTTLFQRVTDLESSAWSRFVQVYGPVIYQWCRKDGLSESDAADVGQDVFRAVATSIQRFDRSGTNNFLGWLRTITRFKVADHFRQAAQSPQVVGGTAFQSLVSHLQQDESSIEQASCDFPPAAADGDSADVEEIRAAEHVITRQALDQIKSRFSSRAWSAFWETTINGRSAKDVGEDLNMTAMAVRKAKSRVLRRLKTEMADVIQLDAAPSSTDRNTP